jgi:hypothetical protein
MNGFMKNFKYYAAVWVLLLLLFNVVVFVATGEDARRAPSFWIGYASVTVALFAQLVWGWLAFKPQRSEAMLYRLSLVSLNYLGALVVALAGAVFMAVPAIPWQVSVLVSAVLLVLLAAVNVAGSGAARYVEGVGTQVATSQHLIRGLTADAESLLARASDGPCEADARRVYEALRYSDPRSGDGTWEIEWLMQDTFSEFSCAVGDGRAEDAASSARELCALAKERAVQCRSQKK